MKRLCDLLKQLATALFGYHNSNRWCILSRGLIHIWSSREYLGQKDIVHVIK